VEWDCISGESRARGRRCNCFSEKADLKDISSRTVQIQAAISAVEAVQEDVSSTPPKSKKFSERLLRWLAGREEDANRRRTTRSRFPKLVAYYWTGGTPKALKLGDIGPRGFYLLTSDRWTPGTRLIVAFQRTDCDIDDADGTITMPSTVMRTGPDGVGFAFVSSAAVDPKSGAIIPADDRTRERLKRFLEQAMS
jgi:hypothetical protein